MRIIDWSSDVCSSDLGGRGWHRGARPRAPASCAPPVHLCVNLVTFCPSLLVNEKADTPAPASLLTNPCASAVDLNGPVSTRLVALSGVHQPCLPFINAGALSKTRAKARARMASLAQFGKASCRERVVPYV